MKYSITIQRMIPPKMSPRPRGICAWESQMIAPVSTMRTPEIPPMIIRKSQISTK